MKRNWYLGWFIFCFYLLISIPVNADTDNTTDNLPEIHLVVDVSASLKKTDPQNLRINAVKMFNYLANQKAKMSLGVFATQYKEIIPLQLVSPQYQRLFSRNEKEINANGAWTNIDEALNAANQSWGKGKKIIVLLTDGKLDLGSDQQNNQSRQQLNDVTIPKLQKNNVQVYTIGLSAESDKQLLENLSLKTNALSQIVLSANDLDSILYAIFTAAIKSQGTPLSKNKDASRSIKIDPSIHEFTLIFKKNESIADLYLTAPDGKKRSLTKENNGILATQNYEIVKMKEPLPGDWILSGPEQQMERVLILTDVSLGTNIASGIYFNGELLRLTGYLKQGTKPITADMAVEDLKMSLRLKNQNTKFAYVIPYTKNGIFANEFILGVPVATYKASWSAQSPYLSREQQLMMAVQETPFAQHINAEHEALMLKLLKPDLIQANSVDINILYNNEPQKVNVEKQELAWVLNLASLCQSASFSEDNVLIVINAQTTNGRDLLFKLPLNGKLCSADAKPLPVVQQSTTPTNQATPPSAKKVVNTATKSSANHSLFLIFILLLSIAAVFIFVMLLGIRYRNKINKLREEF